MATNLYMLPFCTDINFEMYLHELLTVNALARSPNTILDHLDSTIQKMFSSEQVIRVAMK